MNPDNICLNHGKSALFFHFFDHFLIQMDEIVREKRKYRKTGSIYNEDVPLLSPRFMQELRSTVPIFEPERFNRV